jgi:hypothetical protein
MRTGWTKAKAWMSSLALAAAALSFAAAGCGDSNNNTDSGSGSDAGTCGVPPCGGDVVGNWTASSACVDHAAFSMDILAVLMGACPGLSIGDVNLTPTGTLNMGADMSFTGALSVSTTMDVNYPPACVNGASCEALQETLRATTVGTAGITAVTCVGTDACTCTSVIDLEIINASGTWATSGTQLTFAGAPGGNGPYCVQGSSLHLVALDRATMSKVINDIVMTKL